jgi:uncharacterized membrane protein
MFAVHTRRLQPASESGALDRALRFLLAIEPYVAASFLFIAGFSLVLSRQGSASQDWHRRLLRRMLVLYLLAVALFVPQYGIAWPDMLVSPGILSAIALSIAVVGSLLTRDAPVLAFAALGATILVVTQWLDAPGRSIPGLDAGPGGVFPLLAFTCFGAALAKLHARAGVRPLLIVTAASVPVFAFVLLRKIAWTTTEISYYPAHGGQVALGTLFTPGKLEAIPFWNHSALGALGLCFPLAATLTAFSSLPPSVSGARALAPFRVLGRHALAAYVAHLGVLGILDLVGLGPKSAAASWLVVALLTLGAWPLAFAFEGRSPLARIARRLYSQKA